MKIHFKLAENIDVEALLILICIEFGAIAFLGKTSNRRTAIALSNYIAGDWGLGTG